MSVNATDRQEKPIFPTFGAVFAPHNGSYPWPGCHDPSLRPKNEGMLGIIPQDSTETTDREIKAAEDQFGRDMFKEFLRLFNEKYGDIYG